jgi:hypothetical protein
MNRIAFIPAVVVAISLMYTTAPFAEPAAQPGVSSSQKAPATKPKAKAKEPEARVEGSYASEAEAKRACADGTVVWVNSSSKIYHAGGTRDYGKTKQGFYMCQALAERSGFRAVKIPAAKGKKADTKKS